VEVITKDGAKLREHVWKIPGTAENPMTRGKVEKKSRKLLVPILGEGRSEEIIRKVWNLEKIGNVRELRPFFSA